MNLTKYVLDWFKRADDDLCVVEILLKREASPGLACFHSQQAAEKYLKGFIAYHDKHVRKIHDTVTLLEICGNIDSSFKQLQNEAQYLTQFYVESRYPDDYIEFRQEDAEKALRAALLIKEFVLAKIKKGDSNYGFGLVGIIITVSIVAAFGIGGGLYWNEAQKQKSLQQIGLEAKEKAQALKSQIEKKNLEINGNIIETNRNSVVDTSTWKIYRNEKYGFEVKYPNNWEATTRGIAEAIPVSGKESTFSLDINLDYGGGMSFTIAALHSIYLGSYYDSANNVEDYISLIAKKDAKGNIIRKLKKEFKIDERKAFWFETYGWQLDSHANVWYSEIYFQDLQNIYQISRSGTINDELFDQILSTFKFIDPQKITGSCKIDADCGQNEVCRVVRPGVVSVFDKGQYLPMCIPKNFPIPQ